MTEKTEVPKKRFTADWLLRGLLTKLGDSLDRFTGRRWVPSSSLATSELIERIKKLLDAEGKEVAGKGIVVPHNIRLKMQWDKFSDDSENAMNVLRDDLLTAAVDHINDSLYYTFAPVTLEVKRDYFIQGVKLYVSFEKFGSEDDDVEQNVTILGKNDAFRNSIPEMIETVATSESAVPENTTYIARYTIIGKTKETRLEFPAGRRRGVGRTAANDLILDDDSISKFHASIVADENGSLSIADTGSTNGTFIKGQRIEYGKTMRLEDNDLVKFGEVEVRLERVPPKAVEVPDDEKKSE
ncbi:MAG: FHA domain-containing protein [Pyrinomonadaceae bacterium]